MVSFIDQKNVFFMYNIFMRFNAFAPIQFIIVSSNTTNNVHSERFSNVRFLDKKVRFLDEQIHFLTPSETLEFTRKTYF